MSHTDTKLKQALAKMLPELVEYNSTYGIVRLASFMPALDRPHHWMIKDTELLHLCWLVEEEFIHKSNYAGKEGELPSEYFVALRDEVYRTKHSGISIELAMLHATWQQRVEALCIVKGIWKRKCCERDHNHDGNCDRHPAAT